MKKRLLALLMTMVMLFSLFPTAVFAEEGEAGTETNDPGKNAVVIEQEPASGNENEQIPETGLNAMDEKFDDDTPDEAGDGNATEAPNAMLEFVLQPEDGVIREGENYVVSWELNFAPTRQELLQEEYGEDETPQWTLVEELPADARSWEPESPGVYGLRAWLGDTCVLSEAFTVEVEAEKVVEESIAVAETPGDAITPDKVVGKPEEDEIMAYSGTCGDNLTWTLENGVLTISGSGNMTNWSWNSFAPWYDYRESITVIVLPEGLTCVGNYAFYECEYVKTVEIPESVTYIGSDAFSDCSKLTSVTIPEGVTSIGGSAFCMCDSLTSVTIPGSVSSIGGQAFRFCSRLTSVTIPEGVSSIEYYAFSGCTSLISVTIPSTVTNIDYAPFADCQALSEIMVSEENESFRVEDGILYDSELTRLIQCPAARSGAVTIPSSVNVIENGAFYGCSGLTSVTIPEGVTNIGGSAFEDCSGLTSVTIPESVTSIGGTAFCNCSGLTSVTIPEGVTNIGHMAFYRCSSLTSVTIPSTLHRVDSHLFAYCSKLKTILFMADAPEIATNAFDSISATGFYPADNETWTDSKFQNYGANSMTWAGYRDQAKFYTVHFDANGGDSAPADQFKGHGVDITLTSEEARRGGFRFIGWAENPEATEPTFVPGDNYNIDADLTLYAVWEELFPDEEIVASGSCGEHVCDQCDDSVKRDQHRA